MLQRDPAAAAAWLDRMRPDDELEQPRVRCRVALMRAELHWADGSADKALARLPADDAAGMNDELRLRALALRCGIDPGLQARARLALADPRAHASAALQLERALGRAGLAARVERIAVGLSAWPEVQASFRATWLA